MKTTSSFVQAGFFSRVKALLPALLLCCTVLSCRQDAVFYALSLDQEPVEPRVEGTPANIVFWNNRVYTGTIHGREVLSYGKNGGGSYSWESTGSPGASLINLAAGPDGLYALVYGGDPTESTAFVKYDGAGWTRLNVDTGAYIAQTIYGAGGKIFLGGKSGAGGYAVFRYDPAAPALSVIKEGGADLLLTGAAQINPDDPASGIYAATAGGGLYNVSDGIVVPGTAGKNLIGVTSTGGRIVALGNDADANGTIYQYDGSAFSELLVSGLPFTGAMGVWKEYKDGAWVPSLLLIGIHGQGSSVVHGYRELLLTGTGVPTSDLRKPGEYYPSSIGTGEGREARYDASLGKHPVLSVMQVPDGPVDYAGERLADPAWEPLVFAATSMDGLWSYRLRDGNWTWNAEE